MTSKRLLTILVFALPLVVVAFAIVMGSHALFVVSGDNAAATATRWVGGTLAMLLVLDLILLVGLVGVRQLTEDAGEDESS